jgi:hypothetical protein
MSEKSTFTNLFELNLTTLLNNMLDLLENRIAALDFEADQLNSDTIQLSDAIKAAIRSCGDEYSKREVVQALQRLNIFYMKYANIKGEPRYKRLERTNIMILKNKLMRAMTETQARFDNLATDGYRDVVGKHNILKHSLNADPSLLSKYKRWREKNNT